MKRILFTEFFPEENREKSVANPCQMLLETNDKPPELSELEWLYQGFSLDRSGFN
ncbi:hypothetical protein LEP1GSC055_3318 [Leptospira borgpetersenii str. Brem 307]|uniref:Uncharacterized protein n=1 Tax=Leptospira borgpetersenii str. Brem 328 TaxID=1049780 RepID=A0ABC9SCR8_LEPBO|nr:hypothetical protein LEP1GSC055_3318 [Leptospira borgpetersenii str. Brem 307]EMN15593.1 hypothetical protein LEP1GSC056_3553 [Leptospira borgpetersenii str. Brem 328]